MPKTNVSQDKPITSVDEEKPKIVSEESSEATEIDSLDYDNDEAYNSDTYYGGVMTADKPPRVNTEAGDNPDMKIDSDKPIISVEDAN